MARTSKQQKYIDDTDFSGVSDDQATDYLVEPDKEFEEEAPIATQKHRIITEFTKKVPVDPTTTNRQQQSEQPQHIVVQTHASDEPEDEVQRFLDEVSRSTARWEMVVYRLPRYEIENRIDPLSRKRVGAMPFTWEYEAEIQKRWARPNESNHFLVVLRKDGLFVKNGTLPVYSCEPLPIEERIPSGADQPAIPQQVVVPLSAPLTETQSSQPGLSLKDQLKDVVELMKLARQLNGDVSQQNPTASPPLDPEIAVLQLLAKDENVVNKLSKGLLGKIFGEKDEADPWADVAKEALKSGQAAELLRVGIESLFRGFSGLWPGQSDPSQPAMHNPQSAMTPSEPQPQPLTPAEELLTYVLTECGRNSPREAVAENIFAFADRINATSPLQSIDWYIQAFAEMPTDEALNFVSQTYPNAQQITSLPHAVEWTRELQEMLKGYFEGQEDESGASTENAG